MSRAGPELDPELRAPHSLDSPGTEKGPPVLHCIDVPLFAQQGDAQPGLAHVLESPLQHGGIAPGDVAEKGGLRPAQAEEPVTSIARRAQDDVMAAQAVPRRVYVGWSYGRAIGTDDDDAQGAFAEGAVKGGAQ